LWNVRRKRRDIKFKTKIPLTSKELGLDKEVSLCKNSKYNVQEVERSLLIKAVSCIGYKYF